MMHRSELFSANPIANNEFYSSLQILYTYFICSVIHTDNHGVFDFAWTAAPQTK